MKKKRSAARFAKAVRKRVEKNKNHRARRALDRFTDGRHASPVTSKARWRVVEISRNKISRPVRVLLVGRASDNRVTREEEGGREGEREREARHESV